MNHTKQTDSVPLESDIRGSCQGLGAFNYNPMFKMHRDSFSGGP